MSAPRWLLVAAACLACVPAHGAGAWAPAKRLDAWFDELAKDGRVNGSFAISEKGVLRYQRSLGFARIENGAPQPADAGTRYRIGPVSRLFTAMLTMQLAEKASITLDTPLAEFFADVPNALAISYRDLLQERSGLADYCDAQDFAGWRTQPRTRAQMLATINAVGVKFPPRERVEYSHTNSLLLGYVVEKVRNRSYEDLLAQSIAKLGVSRTYVSGTQTSSLESLAYESTSTGWVAIAPTDPSVLGGAGSIVSNAGDLVQIMDALFAGKLVSAQSLETMGNPEMPMALPPKTIGGQAGVGLEGSVDGFSAAVYHFRERQLSIAFTSNGSTVPAGQLMAQAMTAILQRGYKPQL